MRLAAFLITVATLAAQTTFRAGVQEVTVEAVVTDKKGNFQRDLTRDNFKLWEDGKEQQITSLSLEGSGASGRSGRHFIAIYSRVPGDQMRLKLQQPFTTGCQSHKSRAAQHGDLDSLAGCRRQTRAASIP